MMRRRIQKIKHVGKKVVLGKTYGGRGEITCPAGKH
jgi:hypothetical protein